MIFDSLRPILKTQMNMSIPIRLSAVILILFSCTFGIAQSSENQKSGYGLIMDLGLIIRDDNINRDGLGPSIEIGAAKYLDDEGRNRIFATIEAGWFQWNEKQPYDDYVALNVLFQRSLLRYKKYSLPVTAGLAWDYTKNDDGLSNLATLGRLYFGSRFDFDNWAMEVLNVGLNIGSDFVSLKMTYFRAEWKF